MPTNEGIVILAGAGPGDPELITLKLQRALQAADVVISDRLVNTAIIAGNARPDAEIIIAGKQGYHEGSASQSYINHLMVTHAREGKYVVRLKGGDTAFFSHVYEELLALSDAGIRYEIIPGITAASGASAYTGIPLTARNHAQGVQFLSFNPASHYTTEKWKALAQTGDTLVFYMTARNLAHVAELLLRYSRKPQTPVAVIEQATTPNQQVHLSSLQQIETDFAGLSFTSPSLVIIGEVVNLHRLFHWLPEKAAGEAVFPEISHP